jgi:hypothetical protein
MNIASLTAVEGNANEYVKEYCSHNYPQKWYGMCLGVEGSLLLIASHFVYLIQNVFYFCASGIWFSI